MLIEVIILAVLLGWLAGGKLTRLSKVNLVGMNLLIWAFILQTLVPSISAFYDVVGYSILLISYFILLVALSQNRLNLDIILLMIGVFLNFIVILANGGMPVKIEAFPVGFNDHVHIQMTKMTNLPWLGDIIPWPFPGFFGGLVSLGDIFLAAGIFVLVVQGMTYRGQRRNRLPSTQ